MKPILFVAMLIAISSSVYSQTTAEHLNCVLDFYSSFFNAFGITSFDGDTIRMFISPEGTQGTQLYQYLLTREKLFICQQQIAATKYLCESEKSTAVSAKQKVNWFLSLISTTNEYTNFQKLALNSPIGSKNLVATANTTLQLLNSMDCLNAGKTRANLYKN